MSESQSYYVRRRGRTDGPWTVAKLKSEVALKKLGRYDELSVDGSVWRRAGELDELFATTVRRKTTAATQELQLAKETSAAEPDRRVVSGPPATEWYYCGSDDRQVGPLALIQLADEVMAGRCTLDAVLWRDGWSEWRRLEDVPEIMSLLNRVPEGRGSHTSATRMVAVATSRKRTSTNATTALALGATSLLLSAVPFVGLSGLVAVTLGMFAHREIARSRGQVVGSDRATIGVTGGVFAILIGLAWTSYFLYAMVTGVWSEDR